MTSLRGQRVIIASLFLPNAAVPGESIPPTPERIPNGVEGPPITLSLPAVKQRLAEKSKSPSRLGSALPSGTSLAGPLKSIVEDLKDKVLYHILITYISLTNSFFSLRRPVMQLQQSVHLHKNPPILSSNSHLLRPTPL